MFGVAKDPSPLSIPDVMTMLEVRGDALSPDGGTLFYLSNASGTHQIWRRALPDGPPQQLTDLPEPVGAMAVNPASGDLLFTMDHGGDERHQLWLIADAGTAALPKPLTQDPTSVHAWGCWSPDGARIAYSCNARNRSVMDLMVMDPQTRDARCIRPGTGWCDALCFTPDGTGLIVRGSDRGTMDQDLWLVDIETGAERSILGAGGGGAACAVLSARFAPDGGDLLVLCDLDTGFHAIHRLSPESGESAVVARIDGQDIERFAVAPGTGALAYVANDRGYSRLYHRARLTGPEREIALPARGVISAMRFVPDGTALVVAFETAQQPGLVLHCDLAAQRFTTLAGDAAPDGPPLAAPEEAVFTSFDGTRVPAFIYRPPGAGRNLPVLFMVHGGPEAQWRPGWRADLQHYVQSGIMVIAPNVRGSTGYGRAYHQLDDREKRLDAVRDLCAMADTVAAWPEVDAARIGVMGQSYGGYMVLAALAARPDLWKTGVDLYGVSDFITLMRTTGPWRRALRAAEYGAPETMAAFLADISPVSRLGDITAPLLLIHATEDPRVPMEQSEQVFAVLRGLGHPVEFLRLTGEGHGFARRENRITAYARVADFLRRTL